MIFKLEYKNKDLDVARIEIITPGLVEKTIDGTEDPFRLIYKLDKSDKSGHFLTSSAEINIYETEEFNIDALKTSNETEIKVDYYINNIKKWTGFVIPDFFSKEIGKRSVVSMVASDRIGTLKGVTLTDLNAFVSLRTLAEQCLLKTGLSLPLNTMVDLEADAVNFFNIDALSQRLVDNKGRSISCYDILSSILVTSNSIILQRNAEWYIVNKLQHELGRGKLYSDSTTFTNWQDIIHNFSDVTVGARRTIIPVAASTGVYHEHGGGRLHPDNYDFSKGLTGWTSVGGFVAAVDNKEIKGFTTTSSGAVYTPVYGNATEKSYLINENEYIRNVNPKYIESEEISIPYSGQGSIEVEVNVNALAAAVYATPVFILPVIRIAVVATNGSDVLTLDYSGKFVTMPSTNPPVHEQTFEKGEVKNVGDIIPFLTEGKRVKGTLEVSNLEQYKLKIRIYGTQRAVYFHSVDLLMRNTAEAPKGTIFKIEQGSNYTKEHEIDTSIWGDYMTGGLNGYFYKYPIDDTSSLYSNGVLTSKWTDITDPGVERSLLHHITTQRSRMFSQAHDLVSAEMDIRLFDPLSVYVACSKRYTLVSATVDFLRGRANLEIEEAVYQNLTKRDFIYSYFGDGETGVKSIGGISSGTGGGGSGVGMTADQVAILSDVQVLAHDHGNKEVLDQVTQEVVDNALREMIISTDTETELTDENYLSSLRVLKEILDNNEYLGTQFLSKVNPDTAQEIIKFVKGIEIGAFTTGPLGAGASLKMENGVSRLEIDQLDVRMRATFRELIIESLKHVGGQLILSPARMKCTSVVDGGTYYRCYFDTGDGKVSNEFVAGDQARCQVFTGSGVKMYWRLVTSVGTDWINLSKTDAISGSSIPEAGDDIAQLGNRTDTTRQNAQILSTVGADAPSWKQYKGINAFSLEGKDTTVFSGTGNKIDGKTVFMSSGANVEDGINSKNSNYSAQPTSYKANDTWTLSADTTVNGVAYKSGEILTATQDSTTFVQSHWVKKVRYTDDTAVENLQIGGVNLLDGTSNEWQTVTIPSGTVYLNNFFQDTILEAGQGYTFSWEAEWISGATDMWATIGCGDSSYQRDIISALNSNTHAFNRKSIVFTPSTANLANNYTKFAFRWYNNQQAVSFRYRRLKLEKGSKRTDWDLSKKDRQDKIDQAKQEALAASNTVQTNVNSLNTYVTGAFKDGVIDEAEAKAIEKYKNTINETMAKAEASYLKVYANTYLEGTAKTDLGNAKINLWGQRDTLLSAINTAIADGKTTVAEKNEVDSAFNTFNSLMSAFQSALEEANKAIQTKLDTLSTEKVNNIQIGGRNLFSVNNFVADNKVRGYSTIEVIQHEGNIAYRSTNITNNHNIPRYLQGKFEANTQYYFKFNILWESFTDSGALYVFTIRYTDGTTSTLSASTSQTYRALLTSADKTIDYITTTRQYSGNVVIYNIQLEKGNKPTDWTPAVEDVKIDINKAQTDAEAAKLTAEQAQLAADGYMRARYVRDWTKGNTSNNLNQWSEIKIFNKAGINIALGKIPETNGVWNPTRPASNVTDNNIDSNGATNETTPIVEHYAKIDLGSIIYDIDYIQVWHPYTDGRTYYGTKTEISTDGVNWTPVFDSAKSGTYKETAAGNIISFRPNEVLAKVLKGAAVTDTFKTTINGGLISTVMILLRELNSIIETAGISGIQGDGYSPSYWSGGTYSQALAFSDLAIALDSGVTPIPSATLNATMANIVHLHNGIAKIGKLIIGSNGNIYTLKNGVVRFELNANSLPYISSLRDQSEINRTANNTSKSFTINSEEYIFPNSIEVVEDNSTVTVQAQISATAFSDDNPPVNYSTSVFLYLINSDGSTYSTVGFVYAATNSTDTFNVNSKITGVAKGFYKLKAIYTNSSGHYAASGSVGASVMTSQFKVDVSKFMIGENGYMGFYGKNKYIYFNENEDIFFGLRGATDMPGVLAAGSSTSGGAQTNVWGAKSSTAGVTTITSPSAGFRVPLSGLSHSNYVVQITPHTNTTFRVGTKTSTYFEIYGSGGFDYVVIGKNYA